MNLLLHVIPTALDLLLIVACIGLLATDLWVIPRNTKTLHGALWRMLGLVLAALTVVSVIGLFQRTVEMSGLPWEEVFSAVPRVLSGTHYGITWIVRMAAVGVMWLGYWQRGSRRLTSAMMLAAACVAWSVSASSHAADRGDFTLPEWSSWLHIMAGAMWVGGLLAFVLVVWRCLHEQSEREQALFVACAGGLSRLAGIALVLVLTTGACNVWLQLDRFSDLWSSGYGRIILLKIVMVSAMIALGAANRYMALPKLAQGFPHIRQFMRRLTLEAWLALGVLVCAAFLGHAMPPKKGAGVVYMDNGKALVVARAEPVASPVISEGDFSFSTSLPPIRLSLLEFGSNTA